MAHKKPLTRGSTGIARCARSSSEPDVMHKIIFVLFTICLLYSGLSVGCDIPLGKYEKWIASEYSLYIVLKADGKADLVREAWLPGGKEVEKDIEPATWECKGNFILLHEEEGKYTNKGIFTEYSFGFRDIPIHGTALVFADLTGWTFANDGVFWYEYYR